MTLQQQMHRKRCQLIMRIGMNNHFQHLVHKRWCCNASTKRRTPGQTSSSHQQGQLGCVGGASLQLLAGDAQPPVQQALPPASAPCRLAAAPGAPVAAGAGARRPLSWLPMAG